MHGNREVRSSNLSTAKSFLDFSTSIGNGSDFEEQLVHVEGKNTALTSRRDLIEIEDVDLKRTIVSL